MKPRVLFAALAVFALSACTVGPAYERPAVDLPAAWDSAPAAGKKTIGDRWWTLYGDPVLDHIVQEALAHNQDLAQATARVDEARALLRIADSALVPSVDAALARDRRRLSERSSTPLPPGTPLESNNYRAQLNVAYEADLWGRLSSAAEAARADLLASEAARQTVRITLTADVVRAYFAMLSLDSQVASTRRSLELRSRAYELQQIRYDAGLIDQFTLRQLEAEVAAARSRLPALQDRLTAQELALSVLAGRSPRAIMEDPVARGKDNGAPTAQVVPEGLPSDLLLRRPDVVNAEQRLIAANARIGEARAALFPRIVLTGYLGSESAQLNDLFTNPARIWLLGFGLTQPIFQGGRLRAEVEAVEARQRQAVAQYQQTLQEAFREVRQALSTQMRAREIFDSEGARAAALQEALRLSIIRYRSGLLSQLDIIDAERNYLQAELNRADALAAQRASVADLVKALGGGWTGLDRDTIVDAESRRK
jgi:multidrug efflux system outer membrane protein